MASRPLLVRPSINFLPHYEAMRLIPLACRTFLSATNCLGGREGGIGCCLKGKNFALITGAAG